MVTVVLSVEARTEWGTIVSWSNQPPLAAPNTIQKLPDKLIDKVAIDRLAKLVTEFLTNFSVDVFINFLTGPALDKFLLDKLVILR